MRLWVLAAPAIAILVAADVSSPRFDAVFDGIPAAVGTSLLVMTVMAVLVGLFFATYALPSEMESKVAHTVATKPVTAAEIVAGKVLGLSLLLAAMLAAVGAGAYAYILVRAADIQVQAARRLDELRPRATHPADLNAVEAIARRGPLQTYRYHAADEGPEIGIEYGPDWRGPADARWVLAETGMRLSWSLAAAPVREWSASGPCRVTASLLVERAPCAAKPSTESPQQAAPDEKPADAPVQVLAALLPAGRDIGRIPTDPREPVYQDFFDLSASGVLEVTVLAADAPPVKGALNVPAGGDLVLHVLAASSGMLVGARGGSLRIVGPGGQERLVEAAPAVNPGEMRRRVLLAGRSIAPRQTALFRFDDVRPGRLGSADPAFEVGFSLDAWAPPTVQPDARLTFIRSDGQERTLLFHPESHHSTILYLDREFWRGGPLQVRLECLTDEDYFGLVPDSVRLRLDGGPHVLNFARGAAMVWLFGTVLVAIGTVMSARLSWFVSILATITFFVLGMCRGFILGSTPLGPAARRLAQFACDRLAWDGWRWVAQYVVVPLPDLRVLVPDESLSMGQVLPLADLGQAAAWTAAGSVVLVLVGAWLLKRREVAA
ncbi:MAG: hypothetical protein FJ288_11140 [Planctomycetes bacterium]|nr:hypothetical protein [Planctomycetota bacterium]